MIRRASLAVSTAIVTLLSATSAWSAPLEDELRQLVAENPRIKSGQMEVKSAEQGVAATLSPFLPSLDLNGGSGYEHDSLPAFRADKGPFKTEADNYASTLKENLWDGGKKYANRKAAKIQRDIVDLSLTNTRQTVIFEGVSAYLNVLRHTELVGLSDQNSDNIRKQLNLEDERVKRGAGIAVDVLQAKSRLQIAMERLVAAQGALEDAKSTYLEVYGHGADAPGMISPPQVDQLLPTSLDEAIGVAVGNNPNIIAYNKRIDQGLEAKRAIDAEYYPSLDIVATNRYEDNYFGAPGIRRDTTAKLEATWNVFNGFSTNKRAAAAAYDTESRRDDYYETRRKIEEQTRIAWQALQTTTARVSLLDNAVNIASEVFDSRRKLREAGKETVINVLDAENEVYSARLNYASALYDQRIATYQVLMMLGRLEINNLAVASAK